MKKKKKVMKTLNILKCRIGNFRFIIYLFLQWHPTYGMVTHYKDMGYGHINPKYLKGNTNKLKTRFHLKRE